MKKRGSSWVEESLSHMPEALDSIFPTAKKEKRKKIQSIQNTSKNLFNM